MAKTMGKREQSFDLPGTQKRILPMLRSRPMRDALADAARHHELGDRRSFRIDTDILAERLDTMHTPRSDEEFFDSRAMSEAIVLLAGRPVLLIKDGVFEQPSLPFLEAKLSPYRKALTRPIQSVGRIDLFDHETYEWCGTGWRIEEDLIVTNRHVALVFAERQGRIFRYRLNHAGKRVRARIDFKEEYKEVESSEFDIAEILWIAADTAQAPDMAVLRTITANTLPPPLQLASKALEPGQSIAVVGYPARDSRNDAGAMREIFGDIFDVKRFAPGEVVALPREEWYFTHDCSTLGGNSGSAVLDIESGRVTGLHFGGQFRKTNYAVKANVIKAVLRRRSWVPVSRAELHIPEEAFSEKKRTVSYMKNRAGYDPKFLGVPVALPKPGRSHHVLKARSSDNSLPYTHFSIVMSESRRLPILTAVNIDGELKYRLKRKDTWGFDPRIDKGNQIGHKEFYGPASFDKGHMVRREDPGWGNSAEEAMIGEEDTFVYTNAVPQVPQLNQRSWLSLEDYVLENAKTYGFRVSVFTGPVFRDEDPVYRDIQAPLDFWKVVFMIDSETGELCSSAYMLSQEGMMPEEGFRYGPFKTYQVPLQKVADTADLRFAKALYDSDVFADLDITESLFSGRFVEITSPADIVLTRPKGRKGRAR